MTEEMHNDIKILSKLMITFFMLWPITVEANNKNVHYFAEIQLNKKLKRKSILEIILSQCNLMKNRYLF